MNRNDIISEIFAGDKAYNKFLNSWDDGHMSFSAFLSLEAESYFGDHAFDNYFEYIPDNTLFSFYNDSKKNYDEYLEELL